MNETKYVIMYRGKYVCESEMEFCFYIVDDINDATEFFSEKDVIDYIENYMNMNVKNVGIKKITTKTIVESVILYKGKLVSSSLFFTCDVCGETFPVNELNIYRPDLESDKEQLCDKCFDEIDSVYPNIIFNQEEDF